MVHVQSSLAPRKIKTELDRIEQQLGRSTKGENKPRVIDLDLLFYGQQTLKTDELIIPHPEAHCRFFVLKPMADLAPDFIHPVQQKTIQELLDER